MSVMIKRYKNIVIVEPLSWDEIQLLGTDRFVSSDGYTVETGKVACFSEEKIVFSTSGDLHAMSYTCRGGNSARQLYRKIKRAIKECSSEHEIGIGYVSTEFESDDTKVVTIAASDVFCVRLARVGNIVVMDVLKFDNEFGLEVGFIYGNIEIQEYARLPCRDGRIYIEPKVSGNSHCVAYFTNCVAQERFNNMINDFTMFAQYLHHKHKNSIVDFDKIKQGFDECCVLGV